MKKSEILKTQTKQEAGQGAYAELSRQIDSFILLARRCAVTAVELKIPGRQSWVALEACR